MQTDFASPFFGFRQQRVRWPEQPQESTPGRRNIKRKGGFALGVALGGGVYVQDGFCESFFVFAIRESGGPSSRREAPLFKKTEIVPLR